MWTANFWKQAAERAVKSAAQSLLLLWIGDGFNVIHAHWDLALGTAGGAALLSVLSSIVTSRVGEKDSPSAVEIKP